MPDSIKDRTLRALMYARDYRAVDNLLAAGAPLAEAEVEAISQVMIEVEFGRLTLTPGWWPLAKRVLPRSRTLRDHVFSILGGDNTPTVGDAYRKTDRSNLLHAIAALDLSADEIAVLRRLREQMSPPVYREDVDAVLYQHTTKEDQFDALQRIWAEAAIQATGGAKPNHVTVSVPAKPVSLAPEEVRWLQSPFRLLACMPFRIPQVSRVWTERLSPALEALGGVLRLDWSTDDWVRDIRRLVDEASFILVDLTAANPSVRRELGHLLRHNIPCICYATDVTGGVSTVGQIYPTLASDGEQINLEVWGLRVYTANYGNQADIDRLVSILDHHIRPFRDLEDPTARYVGRDLSVLPAKEQRGFELARIPRVRTSAERLAKEGKDLISESAIFRARVFSWLADPHLHIACPENLWLREHLLLIVRDSVRRGYRLTPQESVALHAFVRAESAESLHDLGDEVVAAVQRASVPSPAEKRGLPDQPPKLFEAYYPGGPPVRLRIKMTGTGEPVGLRASVWSESFGATVAELRRAMTGEFGPPTKRRIFALDADGPADPGRLSYLADIEDALDALVEPLSSLTLDMVRGEWTHAEIEIFLQVAVSLAILREFRRRRLFESGPGGAEHEWLAQELGYIWERSPEEFRLFEFASGSRPIHFRGLLPWADIKEQAARVYSDEVARILKDRFTKDEIFEQAMEWDYPPAQPWDIILRTRMTRVAPAAALRGLWARYILPSAFLYWGRDLIYTDPMDTHLWAYV